MVSDVDGNKPDDPVKCKCVYVKSTHPATDAADIIMEMIPRINTPWHQAMNGPPTELWWGCQMREHNQIQTQPKQKPHEERIQEIHVSGMEVVMFELLDPNAPAAERASLSLLRLHYLSTRPKAIARPLCNCTRAWSGSNRLRTGWLWMHNGRTKKTWINVLDLHLAWGWPCATFVVNCKRSRKC